MTVLPFKRETIVLPFPAEEAAQKLWLYILPVYAEALMPDKEDDAFLFNGWIKDRKFSISRKVKSPQNFLPLIKGEIEETSLGSLVFVRYSLFFSSNFFLVFWSAITLFLTFFFIYFYNILLYALIAFVIGIINYVIALANFNIQVKRSRAILDEIFKRN